MGNLPDNLISFTSPHFKYTLIMSQYQNPTQKSQALKYLSVTQVKAFLSVPKLGKWCSFYGRYDAEDPSSLTNQRLLSN